MDPLYNPEGELIGYTTEAEDGALIVFDAEAEQIIAAQDPASGQWLDPSGYRLDDSGDDDDQLTALDARLDRIEQLAAQPPEVMVTRGVEQADLAAAGEDMLRQREQVEQMIGRQLTLRERRLLGPEMVADVEAGRQPDLAAAIERVEHRGEQLHDLDHENPHVARQARQAFMVERLGDDQRYADEAQGLDDVHHEQPPPEREFYDLDDREQRNAYYADRLRGVTDADAGYSSSDAQEQSE